MPDTTEARSKAIISVVLALPSIEATIDPDDSGLTRRFARNDHGCKPELPRTAPCFDPCDDGVEHRA